MVRRTERVGGLRDVEADHADEVARRVDDERRMTEVRAAMNRIPAHERETIELVLWAGLSHADAARTLGVAEGTVKSRLSRGRARLAVALAAPNEQESRRSIRSRRRRTSLVVVLVAAALVATVLMGVLRTVSPRPVVAGPPIAAVDTDAGPATRAQIALAQERCVTWRHLAPVDAVLLARRVSGGAVESTAVVLQLTDGNTVACRIEEPLVSGSPMAGSLLVIPPGALSDVLIGGVDDRTVDDTQGHIIERGAVALKVTADVTRVDVVGSGPAWVETRSQARPYDGWAYVPVEVRSTVTPRPDPTVATNPGGPMPVGKYGPYSLDFPGPTLTVTAYDAAGEAVWSQWY